MPNSLSIEHFPVGRLACTCTIVADRDAREAIVVDGGDDVDEIVARLSRRGVKATYLAHTHAHVDHIGALADLRDRTGARGMLHRADRPLYAALAEQARWLAMRPPRIAKIDDDLRDGDRIAVGSAHLDVLHTPGHTPGSSSFALALGGGRTMLLTGDTLFAGGIGRWDLGGTSMADIVGSIGRKLLVYADDTVVVPGHGPPTTVGVERETNRYLKL